MSDRQPSVLVIDDDRSLLLGLQAIMKRAGYQVLIASSGSEGLTLAEERHPDVIVCDVMMPPPNGLEVRRTLARDSRTAAIPFIFLTARVSQADKVHGIELGADDYITKPFDRDELLARIKAVLRRGELGREQGRLEAEGQLHQLRRVAGSVVTRALDAPPRIAVTTVDDRLERKLGQDVVGDQQAFVKQALQDESHLDLLIDDLMILDALEQGDLQGLRAPVDLQKEFFEIIDRCLLRWPSRNLSSDIEIDDGVEILSPPNLFGRVAVRHLVDNACKFSPQNGCISIRLSANGHGGCSLEVSDQGPGIPVEFRGRVFERYFQLEPAGNASGLRGLGIGLTVVRAFARALGGDVVVQDALEGGNFLLTLPPNANPEG